MPDVRKEEESEKDEGYDNWDVEDRVVVMDGDMDNDVKGDRHDDSESGESCCSLPSPSRSHPHALRNVRDEKGDNYAHDKHSNGDEKPGDAEKLPRGCCKHGKGEASDSPTNEAKHGKKRKEVHVCDKSHACKGQRGKRCSS